MISSGAICVSAKRWRAGTVRPAAVLVAAADQRLRRPGVSHRERAAEAAAAHHHGLVALVSRCERLGPVARRANMADRRRLEVHLLPEGEHRPESPVCLHRADLLFFAGRFTVPDLGSFDSRGAHK